MTTRRQERVTELLQEELSLLIGAELTDPRLADAMVTVTDVRISPDLRNARVYITHSLPERGTREVLAALNHAEGFLRQQLALNLALRFVPELSFHMDETEIRAQRVDEILARIPARDEVKDEAEDEAEDDGDDA